MKGERFSYIDVPDELYHKDGKFEHQQEYRMVLNPNSKKVKAMLKGGVDVKIGSLKDCAMLKSHFYKGALVKVKGKEVQLELREWYNMSGPLHEWEFDQLLLIYGIAVYTDSRYVVDGREISGFEMKDIVKKVLLDKYQMAMQNTWEQTGNTLNLHSIPNKDSIALIHRNEEKDTFHYLRNKAGYEVPTFEKFIKWDPDEKKRLEYSNLFYSSSNDEPVVRICWNYKN